MRDRLIELFKKLEYTPFPEMTMKSNLGNQFTDYALNCIVDEILANGVIAPPCKVGDKIYMLVTRKTHSFEFEEGKRMLRVDNQHTFIKQTYLTKLNFFKVLDDFGKTVFLTKEEAEEKLKEIGK